MHKIFVPQLSSSEVNPVPRKHGFKVPDNVQRPLRYVARWYYGEYYGYGAKDLWIPLNSMGGMFTRAFDRHTVRFPARIDKALRKLLEQKRVRELNI